MEVIIDHTGLCGRLELREIKNDELQVILKIL